MRLTNFMLGGGFGRRLPFTFDYVDLGVRVAKAMSPTPVKTIWTRENDLQHDYYRGAALSRHAGALDANGVPLAAHSNYTGGGDSEAVFMPYAIAAKDAEEKKAVHPIRLGQWRSVLNSQHGFFKESFIDEMAHAAGKDPFEFRRGLLGGQPRFKAALEKAAAMAGWGTALPPGEGRGIAICESFGAPPRSCVGSGRFDDRALRRLARRSRREAPLRARPRIAGAPKSEVNWAACAQPY